MTIPSLDRSASPANPVSTPPAVLHDPCDGLFDDGPLVHQRDGRLLDHEPVRRAFGVLADLFASDAYTYQQPLEGASGPWVTIGGRRLLMLSSYDYLGLIGHPAVTAASTAALRRYGTGTGGVRLLTGTTVLHRELERDIADFKRMPAALTFSSGYLATLGVVTALFGPRDQAIVDARVHRSVIDACRLAGVPCRRFEHNDPDSLRRELERSARSRRTLIVAEGIYSMDGDICPLPEIVDLKCRVGAFLMIDEAHSFGVLGATGRGVDELYGVPSDAVDIWMGSLSKAIPSNGGFVAASREVIAYLQHSAATFMFSSALCPAAVAAAREALAVLRGEPQRVERLRLNGAHLRDGLRELGYEIGGSVSCVIPLVVGGDHEAFLLARMVRDRGIAVTPIVHPAVAHGAARLRLCVTAAHSPSDLDAALGVFRELRDDGVACMPLQPDAL